MSPLLLILFKIFYLFIVLLLTIGVPWSLIRFVLSVKDLSMENVITRCNSLRPLYTMHLLSHPTPSPHVSIPLALVASVSTWHRRLSHPGVDILFKLSHDSSVICSRRTHDLCHACQLGHHTRLPFIISNSCVDNNFYLIHYDMWTSLIVSVSVYKYYLVILDDHSHFLWTFPLHVKSDTFSTLSIFCLCLYIVWPHH
jgi:hypothetical protein